WLSRRRDDRPGLLCAGVFRERTRQQRDGQEGEGAPHAPLPFLAAPSIERSRWPTIISSPGWMVMETSSRRFGSCTSLAVGLALSRLSWTAVTMLGLSMLSASITGS